MRAAAVIAIDGLPAPATDEEALLVWEELEDRASRWWDRYEALILRAYEAREQPPERDDDLFDDPTG